MHVGGRPANNDLDKPSPLARAAQLELFQGCHGHNILWLTCPYLYLLCLLSYHCFSLVSPSTLCAPLTIVLGSNAIISSLRSILGYMNILRNEQSHNTGPTAGPALGTS